MYTLVRLFSLIVVFPLWSADNLPTVFVGSSGSDYFQGGADVRFTTLEEKALFYKVQSRSGGIAKQRVYDGIVQMEARCPVGQILGIRVWVFRDPEAAELHRDRNGPVELQVLYGELDIDKVCVDVSVNSIVWSFVDQWFLFVCFTVCYFKKKNNTCLTRSSSNASALDSVLRSVLPINHEINIPYFQTFV